MVTVTKSFQVEMLNTTGEKKMGNYPLITTGICILRVFMFWKLGMVPDFQFGCETY